MGRLPGFGHRNWRVRRDYKAGEEIAYTVTYLEMTSHPKFPTPRPPTMPGLSLIRAEDPPVRWFLHLYDSVGEGHEWTDWHQKSRAEQEAFVGDPDVSMHVLFLKGWTAGFFMLDRRERGVCDLAYFGLTPEAQGLGLGKYLLQTAILTGWADEPEKMTVNTNTLDGSRALPLYQRMGFNPVRREEMTRILTNDFSREETP